MPDHQSLFGRRETFGGSMSNPPEPAISRFFEPLVASLKEVDKVSCPPPRCSYIDNSV